jgi:hypothetical protein
MGADKIAKAIAAALFAGLAMFEAMNVDDVITGHEWQRIVVSIIGAGLTTWLIPNATLVTPQMIADYLRDRPEAIAAYLRGQPPSAPVPEPMGAPRWPTDETGR